MGDIDFEEQLELERLEKEALEKDNQPREKVDPDGTVYEWDHHKKAWFPKIDAGFIAQYQMNYGEQSDTPGQGDADKQSAADYEKYYKYYQNYYEAQAQHERLMNKKKEVVAEDTHDEAVGKLETLESKMQEGTEDQADQSHQDSAEEMAKYTEDQKREYNEYWSYYYGTEMHDYYSDCMKSVAQDTGGNQEGTENSKGGKEQQENKDEKKKKKRKAQQPERPAGWFEMEEKDNTNVYVSGLPPDISLEEFTEMMNKYGLIMFDPRTKKPKTKIYFDENGQPKGDGRCCFIKRESVDLAISLLDGSDLRGHTVHVEMANFTMKGDYDPSKKKKRLTNKEKNRLRERQARLFDWRPERPVGSRMKHEKVVILKNVFDPKEFEDNPALINNLSRDMRTECSKYGEVKKVSVFDRHEDGVVAVHFKEAEEADVCVENLHHRYFAKRRLMATTWDGTTKYEVVETEEERELRLKKWEKFLESDDKEDNKNSSSSASEASTSSKNISVSNDGKSSDKTCANEAKSDTAEETKADDDSTNNDCGTSDSSKADGESHENNT